MTKHKVIGLVGAAGVGKSAVARELIAQHGYKRMSLAHPLKLALRAVLSSWGYNEASCDYWIEGDGKERPCPALKGQTPRLAMQLLGTEYGRQGLDENIWVDHLVKRIENLPEGTRVVVDDVRFDNEANALAMFLDAQIVKVVPAPGKSPKRQPPAHASEGGVDDALIDWSVENDFTYEGVNEAIRLLAAVGVIA